MRRGVASRDDRRRQHRPAIGTNGSAADPPCDCPAGRDARTAAAVTSQGSRQRREDRAPTPDKSRIELMNARHVRDLIRVPQRPASPQPPPRALAAQMAPTPPGLTAEEFLDTPRMPPLLLAHELPRRTEPARPQQRSESATPNRTQQQPTITAEVFLDTPRSEPLPIAPPTTTGPPIADGPAGPQADGEVPHRTPAEPTAGPPPLGTLPGGYEVPALPQGGPPQVSGVEAFAQMVFPPELMFSGAFPLVGRTGAVGRADSARPAAAAPTAAPTATAPAAAVAAAPVRRKTIPRRAKEARAILRARPDLGLTPDEAEAVAREAARSRAPVGQAVGAALMLRGFGPESDEHILKIAGPTSRQTIPSRARDVRALLRSRPDLVLTEAKREAVVRTAARSTLPVEQALSAALVLHAGTGDGGRPAAGVLVDRETDSLAAAVRASVGQDLLRGGTGDRRLVGESILPDDGQSDPPGNENEDEAAGEQAGGSDQDVPIAETEQEPDADTLALVLELLVRLATRGRFGARFPKLKKRTGRESLDDRAFRTRLTDAATDVFSRKFVELRLRRSRRQKVEAGIDELGDGVQISDGILAFIDAWQDGRLLPDSDHAAQLDLRAVSDAHAQRIKDDTGLDVSGFRHAIETDQLRHAFENHGPGSSQDPTNIPITPELVSFYLDTVEDPDELDKVKRKKGSGPTITYRKVIDGVAVIVQQIRAKDKKLVFFNMWVEEII